MISSSSRTVRFLPVLAVLASLAGFSSAAAATSIATVPVGYLKVEAPTGATTSFGVPLDDTSPPATGIRAGKIESFTANTIGNANGGWTGNLGAPTAPWLVRITSGPSAGKTLEITANTATTLTVGGADLTTLGLTAGTDTFELVPMDTLWSLFGNTLQGGVSAALADNVHVRSGTSWLAYFYDTNLGYWRRTIGPATNSNNVLIRPQSGVQLLRRGPTLTLTFAGRVLATPFRAPIVNGSTTVIHAGFPTDTTLGDLAVQTLLAGWRSGSNPSTTDTLALYNGSTWVNYVHNGTNWQPFAGPASNSDGVAIPAGALMNIQRLGLPAGTTDLVRPIPYSL
jgi:uncharacterized protein (TIGR02597 family)